ncbi:hypothetical protein FDP41_006320 [Naegleria fowleri]|uniref:Uncharacterized protein n=1 Tax=Naegleria fowleri TaxID=5763 RepID=A0A6A5BJ54_NAEFO|nr:uncharacterized protein FDP41_006320 [Naegleria fowleri]KAF0974846.1 hypothetical protein FDP41_006320 [Naegleria fowleri]CAG4707972.1 unnamed protein product [Naegleria fowleri]
MSSKVSDEKPSQFSGREVEKQPHQHPHEHATAGLEHVMMKEPQYDDPEYYKGSDKLKGKVALITGGDSGIGRSICVLFAREGADIAIVYLDKEQKDADITKQLVEKEGRKCLLIPGDVTSSSFCKEAVEKTVKELKHLDVLVNHAGTQHVQEDFTQISDEQIEKTFRTNIFAYMYMAREALHYLPDHTGVIINTSSVTAYKGKSTLIDYSSTKGANTTFTKSLALSLADRGIRVNCVAPGPIWTPLIPSTFSKEMVEQFGKSTPMKRAGQPFEVATAYVYLASKDSSYVTGQTIHVNGGEIVE